MNLYIEYAELQALERRPMTMRDWITKLDEFLKISGRELLDHAGKIPPTTPAPRPIANMPAIVSCAMRSRGAWMSISRRRQRN